MCAHLLALAWVLQAYWATWGSRGRGAARLEAGSAGDSKRRGRAANWNSRGKRASILGGAPEFAAAGSVPQPQQTTLEWHRVGLAIEQPGGTRALLHDVSGAALVGSLQAVLGPSGEWGGGSGGGL